VATLICFFAAGGGAVIAVVAARVVIGGSSQLGVAWEKQVLRFAQDDKFFEEEKVCRRKEVLGGPLFHWRTYCASMKVTVTWVRMGTFLPSTVKGL
jgi:hypothetical protein